MTKQRQSTRKASQENVDEMTKRKQAEEALRASEEQWRSLVKNIPDIIMTLDRDGTISLVNRTVPAFTVEGTIGTTVYEYVPPEYHDTLRKSLEEAFETGEAHDFEIAGAGPADRTSWYFNRIGPVVRDGRVVAATLIATDITERKRAEEALSKSRQMLENIAQGIADGILLLSKDFKVLWANRAAMEQAGCEGEKLIGSCYHEVSHHRDSPCEPSSDPCPIHELQRTGEPVTVTHTHLDAEGKQTFVDVTAYPIKDENGEIVEFVHVSRDVTERKRAEEALAESEGRYRDLYEEAPIAYFSVGTDGSIRMCNRLAGELLGYAAEELMGRPVFDLYADTAAGKTKAQKIFRRFRAGEEIRGEELEMRRADGEQMWISLSVRPLRDAEGRIVESRSTVVDITQRKRAEEELREAEGRYRSLVEASPDAITLSDLNTNIIMVNEQTAKMHGYDSPEDVVGLSSFDFIAPEDRERAVENAQKMLETGTVRNVEYTLLRKDGSRFPAEQSASLIVGAAGSPLAFTTVTRDITERKKAEEAVRHLAYHDSLTGLPNRPLLIDRLEIALAQARRSKQMVAVMALDLDRFKVVNDTVGHAEGDRLLQQVSEQLAGLVRDGDTVARFGGDEFTVVLPQAARIEDAIQVGERILEALRQPTVLGGEEFRVTTSIGIATYPVDGDDADTLLQAADWALYRAKDEGRDNYQVCTPAIAASLRERISIERDLRRALERDEMTLHYQPLVEIETGQVIGVEALVRWQHPKRGLLLPGAFLDVAEYTGLIVPLGNHVLKSAAAQHKAWRDAGLRPGRLAVNFSARQFRDSSLPESVREITTETGLDPQHLQVEITEQTAMQDADYTLATLGELKMVGVTIAVDDFGAGYSSLGYLRRYPIDVLKIDRSFIDDLVSDPNDAAISAAIIAMGHTLNLKVIAEGVETEEQLAFLRKQKCDEFQGYLFSKPLPPPRLEKLLKRGKRLPVAAR